MRRRSLLIAGLAARLPVAAVRVRTYEQLVAALQRDAQNIIVECAIVLPRSGLVRAGRGVGG